MNFLLKVGCFMYLSKEIIEPACEDHPEFLMGEKGEKVKVLKINPSTSTYPILVEGPTNPGKPWYANASDLMHTKPIGDL